MNVAPLQLKGPATLQPALMITAGNTTPEGSGTSTRGDSSRMRRESPPHLSAQRNPEMEHSQSPTNALKDFEAITMDADDVFEHTDAPTAG